MAKRKSASAVVNRYAVESVATEAAVAKVATGLVYDYSGIDAAHRPFIESAAREIHDRRRRQVEDMFAIGRLLNEVRRLIPGRFNAWVKEEFGMSLANASELRNVADRFDEKDTIIVSLQPTIVRMLAAPSVPDEVVAAVKVQAQKVDDPSKIKIREARAIWDQFRFQNEGEANGAPKHRTQAQTIDAEYSVEPIPVIEKTAARAELRKRSVVPSYMQPPQLKSGEMVALLLPTTVAQKLHAAVLIRSLRFHLTVEEQAELQFALEEALPNGEKGANA